MGKTSSHKKMAMKNIYYSTFISGLSEVVEKSLKEFIKDVTIISIFDGLVVYKTASTAPEITALSFFNNSFFLLTYSNDNLDTLIGTTLHPAFSATPPKGIFYLKNTFRIIISKENELQHIEPSRLRKLEDNFSKKLRLNIDRANPDIEIWFLERSEGYSFCGIRLTKKPSTDKYLKKGELRPELAWLLCYLSEPKKNDIFLDPFAGYGSIAFARTTFPYSKIIAADNDQEKVHFLSGKKKKVEIQNWDVTKLPLKNNSIDKVVTDPPWGVFEKENVEELYEKFLIEFARVLKPKGIVVILTAQKELMGKLIKSNNDLFSLKEKYDVLVSGKKAGVYKFQKI